MVEPALMQNAAEYITEEAEVVGPRHTASLRDTTSNNQLVNFQRILVPMK